VAQSDVVLAIVGPRWLEHIQRRTANNDDFVAIEIKAALTQGKRVIPVLVGGAEMPRSEDLPESIRDFSRRNAVGLRPDRFKADCQGLVNALKDALATSARERQMRSEAERAESEAARRRRETEEAERIAAMEASSRERRMAGLSSEDIRKAEELASWDFVKEANDEAETRDHLARFPGCVTERMARSKLEKVVLASLEQSSADLRRLQAFVEEFPNSAALSTIKERISDIENAERRSQEEAAAISRERSEFARAIESRDSLALNTFASKYPYGELAASALREAKRITTEGKSPTSAEEEPAFRVPRTEADWSNDNVILFFAVSCILFMALYWAGAGNLVLSLCACAALI
jgi:hypothetical protein